MLSDAIAQKTKAERAKVLLEARLTAVAKANSKGGEARRPGGDQAVRSQAYDFRAPNHDCCPRCTSGGFDPSNATPATKQATQQRGVATQGVGDRETRQAGNGEEPPGQHHDDHRNPGLQRSASREGWQRQELEPEDEHESKDTLEDQDRAEPELEQEVELEREKFEAERQTLKRERQESSEAAQQAEARVREVEAAWQALAGKAVALAERNVDLEWVRQ